jgi:site-specific recombinase XerD
MTNMVPSEALQIYLKSRENEVTEQTLYSHKSRLGHFVQWCELREIEEVSELERGDMNDYRIWRRNDGDLSKVSEKTQMDTLRVFIRRMEKMGHVEKDLSHAVISPNLSGEEKANDDIVTPSEAESILKTLDKYHYSSRLHTFFILAWRTGMRTSALRAVDLQDMYLNDSYITVSNRPETEARLKNGSRGERHVALRDDSVEVLSDYIERNRIEVSDDWAREPLLSTRQGRPHAGTVRNWAYYVTRPCFHSNSCPHARTESECTAAQDSSKGYECPSSTAAHSIRRGSITNMLQSDVPVRAVSDRCNVSEEVLAEHYDARTSQQKMEQRRKFINSF